MTGKDSDSKTTELRQEIVSSKRGMPNAHVPTDLRKRAVEMMEAAAERGIGKKEIAVALGVHPATLLNWQKQLGSPKRFVPARVVVQKEHKLEAPKSPSVRPLRVMVIDGLDLATLALLLRGGA